MLRNKLDQFLTLEMGLLFLFIFYFFENSSSFCRENEIFKNKKKQELGPVFNTRKGKNWTSF